MSSDPNTPLDYGKEAPAKPAWRWPLLFGVWSVGLVVWVFYLAVLPAFLGAHAPLWTLLVFASTHAAIGLVYLSGLVLGVHRARAWLARRRVRRSLDAATGVALLGFSARLALD